MNSRKFLILPMLLLSAATLFSGQQVIEAIVAVINDEVITLSDFRQEHDALYQTLRAQVPEDQFDEQYKALRGRLLEKMITDRLLLQEAERMGADVTEQVNMMVNRLKEQGNIESDEQLIQAFRQQNVDFEAWKREQEKQAKQQFVINSEVGRDIVVDDNEVINYYRQNPGEFTDPEQVTLKAIFLSSEGKIDEELEGRKQEILGKLESGREFAETASTYSEGPEKESGGDLGVYKQGELAKPLEDAVKTLQAGETSPWLNLANGWYLLHLVERKSAQVRPFDDCRKQIEELLFSQKNDEMLQGYLEKLKARSYIKILLEDPLKEIGIR